LQFIAVQIASIDTNMVEEVSDLRIINPQPLLKNYAETTTLLEPKPTAKKLTYTLRPEATFNRTETLP
jgi:hypothetical protein